MPCSSCVACGYAEADLSVFPRGDAGLRWNEWDVTVSHVAPGSIGAGNAQAAPANKALTKATR
ncbi:MAG: hypothetical protein GY802_15180 [Gammaproteobacteria bacterium]|nr:hypothetical protein [Gammaproteobacteria bacterium]